MKGIKIAIFKESFIFRCFPEAATGGVLYIKKVFLKILQYSQENTCVGIFFFRKTLTHVFSCENYKFFKKAYFKEDLQTAASGLPLSWIYLQKHVLELLRGVKRIFMFLSKIYSNI